MLRCAILCRSNPPPTNSQRITALSFPSANHISHLLEWIFYGHLPYWMINSIWAGTVSVFTKYCVPDTQHSDGTYAGLRVDSEFCLFILTSDVVCLWLCWFSASVTLASFISLCLFCIFVHLWIILAEWKALSLYGQEIHYYFYSSSFGLCFLYPDQSFRATLMDRLQCVHVFIFSSGSQGCTLSSAICF